MKNFIFGGSTGETPESIARKRALAEQLLAAAGSGAGDIATGLTRLGQGIGGRIREGQANRAEAAGRASAAPDSATLAKAFGDMFGGDSSPSTSAAPSSVSYEPTGDTMRDGIAATAQSLGIDPIDLATAISYETGGTFSPTQKGPTTKWGQHKGLIQFGEPQAKKFGVDWNDPVGSQLGPGKAVAKYLIDAGVKPGMGMMDIYSAINAGGVGLYNRSDEAAGGAPGTVADKVNNQMAGHRAKALAMFGGDFPKPDAIAPASVGWKQPSNERMAEVLQNTSMPAAQTSPVQQYGAPQQALAAQLLQSPQNEQIAPQGRISPFNNNALFDRGDMQGRPAAIRGPQPAPQGGGMRQMLSQMLSGGGEPTRVNSINGRPILSNPDGTFSTEETITVTDPRINQGAPTNIPSIWNGQRTANEDEAVAQAIASGQQFQPFQTIDQAVSAARARSNQLAQGIPAQGGSSIDIPQIMEIMQNPWMPDGVKEMANIIIRQRMQDADPLRQLEIQRGQQELITGAPDYVSPVDRHGMSMDEKAHELAIRKHEFDVENAALTPEARNAKFFAENPELLEIARDLAEAKSTKNNVTIEGDAPRPEPIGTEGNILVPDETAEGGYRIVQAPGSKAARELEEAAKQEELAETAKETAANLVLDEISIARELIQTSDAPTTGIAGGLLANINSTDAGKLKNRLTTIKANIGFDKLQAMRDASPTGGALGQVSEFENRLLQAVFGSLEQSQEAGDILYNLERLETIYNRIIHEGIPEDEARSMYRDLALGKPQIQNDAPPDVPADVWELMTPEEKKLWQN